MCSTNPGLHPEKALANTLIRSASILLVVSIGSGSPMPAQCDLKTQDMIQLMSKTIGFDLFGLKMVKKNL